MGTFRDLTGKRFGKLLVLKRAKAKTQHIRWECRCDCGTIKTFLGYTMWQGKSNSCGCAMKDNKPNLQHGKSRTLTHRTWKNMKARCYRPTYMNYHLWGGRGITVCDRWRNSFPEFLKDMGEQPPGLQLDRIDNNGNYEPGNCRWATRKVQMNNTRNTLMVTFGGKCQPLTTWCQELNIPYGRTYQRLHSLKHTVEQAFKA